MLGSAALGKFSKCKLPSRSPTAALCVAVIQVKEPPLLLPQSTHIAGYTGRGNADKPQKLCSWRETQFLTAEGYWWMLWVHLQNVLQENTDLWYFQSEIQYSWDNFLVKVWESARIAAHEKLQDSFKGIIEHKIKQLWRLSKEKNILPWIFNAIHGEKEMHIQILFICSTES